MDTGDMRDLTRHGRITCQHFELDRIARKSCWKHKVKSLILASGGGTPPFGGVGDVKKVVGKITLDGGPCDISFSKYPSLKLPTIR